MITKREIKAKIESALNKLHEAEDDLQDAMLLIGSTGNRIAVAGSQALLKQTIASVEDLIYESDDELEVFAIVNGEGEIVGKYSEANHV